MRLTILKSTLQRKWIIRKLQDTVVYQVIIFNECLVFSADILWESISEIEDYDFYIANKLNEWTREALYNREITGVDFIETLELEHIIIPKQLYVIVQTEKTRAPMDEYVNLRRRLISEWLPGSGYQLIDSPELALVHWRPTEGRDNRYVEIWLPIEKI